MRGRETGGRTGTDRRRSRQRPAPGATAAAMAMMMGGIIFSGITFGAVTAQAAFEKGVLIRDASLSDFDMETYTSYGYGHIQSISLTEEDADAYPQLAASLEAYNTENKSELTETFNEFCEASREDRKYGHEYEAYVQTDIMLRRADEEVFSFLVSFSDYSGGAHGYYSYTGFNYNTAGGEPIPLSDVVADDSRFREVVCRKLKDKYGAYLEPGLEDLLGSYAISGGEYEYNWLMNATGIYVMFNPYAIAPYASGAQHVHIGFEEYPDLFTGAYHRQQGSYAFRICEWLDDRIDPDGDGLERILELPKEYDEYGNLNTLTVRVDRLSAAVNDLFYYSPAFYLFCMEDGRAYLYADVAVENDYHLLEIFDLSGDAPRWAGEEYGGFGMLWDSEREESALHIPTGPDCFALNKRLHLLSTHTGQRENRIGEDGLPQPAGTLWYTANENAMITLQVVKDIPATIIDEAALSLPAEDMTGTEGYIRAGESVKIWRSDGWSMMDLRREDGSAARIYIDTNDWPHTINGEDESSFFEQLYYAG